MTNYFKFGITLFSFLAFFTQCEKGVNQEQKFTEETALQEQPSLNKQQKVTDVNCPVPAGYTVCTSTCFFTDCCIVWDPKKETGGCSCILGFAKCATAAIQVSKGGVAKSTAIRTITFHLKKFESFIQYARSNNLPVSVLEASYRGKILPGTSGENPIVNNDSYDLFVQDYEGFVNSLTANQLKLVKSYIGE